MKNLPFKSATFNPLDFISKDSPLGLDDCNDIAQALVVRTGEEREPHWNDSAEKHIAAAVATVVQYGPPGRRSLQEVADLLSSPKKLALAIKLMQESPAWEGMLARKGAELTHFVEREKASVLTTTLRFLTFLNTPAMAASTRTSSFTPRLKRVPTTLYIVLPAERMKACMGWLRLMIGSMIRSVVREGLTEYPNVHYVLDEAASLGVMDAIEDLVDKYRGYGCRAQFYYQSYGQLMKCWPKDQGQTLLSNTAKIFCGVNDLQTAELVSKTLGTFTNIVESGGTSTNGGSNTGWSESHQGGTRSGGSNRGWSENYNWQQSPRELLKPDEVMALPPRTAITLPGFGIPPVLSRLIPYWEMEARPDQADHAPAGFASACRTLLVSAVLLAAGIVLAVLLTGTLQAQAQPNTAFPQEYGAEAPQAPAPGQDAVTRRFASFQSATLSRAQLAQLVRRSGYRGLDEAQKASCTQLYLKDLRRLHSAVHERLLASLATIPGFQWQPQCQQMNRALQLLALAIADLEQHGTATDCTRYQRLIDEVNLALSRP